MITVKERERSLIVDLKNRAGQADFFSTWVKPWSFPTEQQNNTWNAGHEHRFLRSKSCALSTPPSTPSSSLLLQRSIKTNSRQELHFLWNIFGKGQDFSSLYSFWRWSHAAASQCVLSPACHPWGSQRLALPPVWAWWLTVSMTLRQYLCVRICKCVSISACVNPPSHSLRQICLCFQTFKSTTLNFKFG